MQKRRRSAGGAAVCALLLHLVALWGLGTMPDRWVMGQPSARANAPAPWVVQGVLRWEGDHPAEPLAHLPHALTAVPAGVRSAAPPPAADAARHAPAPAPPPPPSPATAQSHHASAAPDDPQGHERPRWPTRAPQDFDQSLLVRRGAQSGQGRWTWVLEKGRFRSTLRAEVEAGPAGARSARLEWSTQGGLDAYGIAPDRFLTRPSRGGARAVNFQRDSGRVSYSGPTGHAGLVPGAQDRLSWLAQLLAIVQARLENASGTPPEGSLPPRLPVWVAGPQGDSGDWWFDVAFHRATGCWHFRRQAERRYDVQVDLWVAATHAPSGHGSGEGSGAATGVPTARLARLSMGAEGSRQAPWELFDPTLAAACGPSP
ncbi:MAG: hypothetical protein RIR43_2544 [Pseudomonadota bacterium]